MPKNVSNRITIGLWHKDHIEKLLIQPNAKYICDAFGLDGTRAPVIVNERVIIPLPSIKHQEYENALFIKKTNTRRHNGQ